MKDANPWRENLPSIDFSLDLRGEVCPHPVMLTLEQLGRMRSGQILQIVVDCPSALVNIPIEVHRHGHATLAGPTARGTEATILVRADLGPRSRANGPNSGLAVAKSPEPKPA